MFNICHKLMFPCYYFVALIVIVIIIIIIILQLPPVGSDKLQKFMALIINYFNLTSHVCFSCDLFLEFYNMSL